jgi:hypothetical protein
MATATGLLAIVLPLALWEKARSPNGKIKLASLKNQDHMTVSMSFCGSTNTLEAF